jgi:citrate/tricarballylate utilization protein
MTICNSCRYCEGLCATFQSMTQRRVFAESDLDYLANLCHNCTACYHDCQYAPPHSFDVNVPRALTALRVETYEKYAWPSALARLFHRNGLVVSLATAMALTLVMVLTFSLQDGAVLFGRHSGPGSFYAIIGHGVMVAVAGITFVFSVLAMTIAGLRFARATGGSEAGAGSAGSVLRALRYAAAMKYLDGGHGEGCGTRDDAFSNQRRYFHQFTMWGFLLCFAATCVATVYDYGLGLVAPYPFFSLPVMLGTIGGIGLLIGPVGLVSVKLRSDPRPMLVRHYGMDYAFLTLLFLISLTGLLLLGLRDTAAMGVMLAIHLSLVLAFFITLPYSKFVHAIYRLAALIRFSAEQEKISR